jgi:hypothetical protein
VLLSRRNLFDIQRFFLFYNSEKVRQAVAQIGFQKVQQPVRQLDSELICVNQESIKVQQAVAQIP